MTGAATSLLPVFISRPGDNTTLNLTLVIV
jgi:hypothetical protein